MPEYDLMSWIREENKLLKTVSVLPIVLERNGVGVGEFGPDSDLVLNLCWWRFACMFGESLRARGWNFNHGSLSVVS